MSHRVAIVDGKSAVTTADLEHLALDFLAAGVVGTNDYKVEQQLTPDMTVKVNTGKAYVFNSTGSEAFRTELDVSANVTIGANVSGNPRIDAIVIKIDKSATPNSGGTNVATLVAVQGTPAASPSAPLDAAIQTAIGAGNPFRRLANVTVANGAVSITTANISDTRTVASPVTRTLKSATTAIDVASAAAPTAGQVLTALSATAAAWQSPSNRLYVGTISTTYNAATGNVSYTGVGFQPTSIQFLGVSAGGSSVGFATATSQHALLDGHNTGYFTTDLDPAKCIYLSNASGTNRQASLVSLDADGFTLNWTKVGAPTGNIYIQFIARG